MDNSRFVVGVDGSAEAVRWASRLASVLGGEIVVVHAFGLLEQVDGETVVANQLRGEIEEFVEREWCAGLQGQATPFRVIVRDGCPVDVLVAVAQEEQPCLIVVGSRGLGAAPALALGSTSLHLLQVTPAPVLVVPGREEGAPHLGLRRILVGVDDPAAAGGVLEAACHLAQAFGAWVDLVNAVDDVPVFPLGPATNVSSAGEWDAHSEARRQMEALRRTVSGRGVPVHVRVERGAAHEIVRSAAASIDADLIVVGSTHVGHPAEPVLGDSVSRRIVSIAHRPILVVPALVPVASILGA